MIPAGWLLVAFGLGLPVGWLLCRVHGYEVQEPPS